MSHVSVLVPGIMGSVLELDGDVVWPGSVASLALPYRKMNELLSPNLIATDCIRSFVLPQYQAIIDDLATLGFREADGTLVIAAYDWRRSIEDGAQVLASRLKEVVARNGSDVEISIVAHSMGGLLSRYFLESGKHNDAPGWPNVTRLITLATPHRGAAIALPLVMGMEKKLFLAGAQVVQLASRPEYPSAYQLLPRRGEPIAWNGGAADALGGSRSPIELVDIYDSKIAAELSLVPANLQAAIDFHAALDAGRRPPHVRYFCFSGNRQNTATYALFKSRLAGAVVQKVEQEVSGDGTVPIWSSTLPLTQFLYVAGEHGTIFKTGEVRTILSLLLGRPGILATGAATDIAVNPEVVDLGSVVHATLNVQANTTDLRGEIRLARMEINEDGVVHSKTMHAAFPVRYTGPQIETFIVSFSAPSLRGHYEVAYFDEYNDQVSASKELIVQSL